MSVPPALALHIIPGSARPLPLRHAATCAGAPIIGWYIKKITKRVYDSVSCYTGSNATISYYSFNPDRWELRNSGCLQQSSVTCIRPSCNQHTFPCCYEYSITWELSQTRQPVEPS